MTLSSEYLAIPFDVEAGLSLSYQRRDSFVWFRFCHENSIVKPGIYDAKKNIDPLRAGPGKGARNWSIYELIVTTNICQEWEAST